MTQLYTDMRRQRIGFASAIETCKQMIQQYAMSGVARGLASHLRLKHAIHPGVTTDLSIGRQRIGFASAIETLCTICTVMYEHPCRQRIGFASAIET